ncbi:hypothetical protein VMCG_04656 [Cytospora schulzeri]|uniref:CN hydrolase domain-containing protein n=1 Tax=Cytospora schulzeri TaxID=448051 RepID=A0A423WRT2_9PEZI|nr:hypothetical protein VMCG_04656 [Valsa malicola]
MRIGCLQFAPQVGDIDNNLNRADSVLAKANPEDLDTLDVLVLPELAFTGYNFKSLQQISPYLEPSGSGISSLWARTTALKYNTNVVVGYPERVDVSSIWPTGPEYYNSAIMVNGDGETVANYRKSFLYSVDESWALEGQHGFFEGHVRGLGQTAMGICKDPIKHVCCCLANSVIGMDLNPYKFEAPWHAFEFGFHILEVRAHLVIVTMAWLTREDKRHFSRMPAEPDMDTLTYWIQRLEPVIRAEDNEEVIVVFCNRTGSEGDAVYAGTSAVVGIKEGEVHVYGLLGRGSKEVLVVDTDDPPFAKLVHRPEGENTETNSQIDKARSQGAAKKKGANPREAEPATWPTPASSQNSPKGFSEIKSRKERPTPRIEIPEERYQRTTSTSGKTPIEESPGVPTPTAPSPTPLSARPKLVIPGMRPSGQHIDTPYPRGDEVAVKGRILGGSVSISNDTPVTAYSDQDYPTEKYFWLPSDTLLEAPMESPLPLPPSGLSLPAVAALPVSPTVSMSLQYSSHRSRKNGTKSKRPSSPESERSSSYSIGSEQSRQSRDSEQAAPARPATRNGHTPARPASPKSRNASRSGRHERRESEAGKPDLDAMFERLDALRHRTPSAMAQRQDQAETSLDERPKSPKSRNASRSGRPSDIDLSHFMERALNFSRGSIPIGAGDSVLGGDILRPRSDILAKDQRLSNGSAVHSPPGHHHTLSDPDRAASQVEGLLKRFNTPGAHIEPVESRTMLWSEISKIVGEHMTRPESQEAPRGRQRSNSAVSTQVRQGSRETPANVRAAPSQTRQGNGGGIRSVRDPSMGPPADPDDEIVAEIIFRRPDLLNNTSRSNSRGAASTPDRPGGNTPSRRDSSRSIPDDKSVQGKKAPSPLGKDGKDPVAPKQPEGNHSPAPPAPQATRDDLSEASPPDLSGSSIHTLNSGKTSPSTPSSRVFEPTTPKAMIFASDYGSMLSTASDPLSNLRIEHPSALVGNQTVVPTGRPRSAVW